MERVKLGVGQAPNDNTGDLLRDGAIIIEDTFSKLFAFLTGNLSDVNLLRALPKNAGGTGAHSEQELYRFFLLHGAAYFQPNLTVGRPVAVCTARAPSIVKKVVFDDSTDVTFIKMGLGLYKITCSRFIALEAWDAKVVPDSLGNAYVGVEVTKTADGYDVNVYKRVFNTSTGMYALDKNTPMDVPENNALVLTLTSTLASTP